MTQCEKWLSREEQCPNEAVYEMKEFRDGKRRGTWSVCEPCKRYWVEGSKGLNSFTFEVKKL